MMISCASIAVTGPLCFRYIFGNGHLGGAFLGMAVMTVQLVSSSSSSRSSGGGGGFLRWRRRRRRGRRRRRRGGGGHRLP